MTANEFISVAAVQNPTPNGGQVTVAFGHVYTDGQMPLEAIAIQVKDYEGTMVTEFALQSDSFGVLIESIKELFDDTF